MKKFFLFIIPLFLLFSSSAVSAQEETSGTETLSPEILYIQDEIQSAVSETLQEDAEDTRNSRAVESVSQILLENKSSENYSEIENLVLSEVQELVSAENFELARNLAMTVIKNNVENFEAIDLYSYIEKVLANERAYKRSQELRRFK